MDPYRAFAFPVRIIKEAPTYPVGGLVMVGSDDNFYVVRNLNTDEDVSNLFHENAEMTGFEFPRGITFEMATDGHECFYKCPKLEGLTEGITFKNLKNGKMMFQDCRELESLPSSIDFGSLENGDSMFQDCTSLTEFPGGGTMKSLVRGRSMFAGCYNLKTIPEGVDFTYLNEGRGMFDGCELLEDVPSTINLKSLQFGHTMFAGCKLTAQSVINVLESLAPNPYGSLLEIGKVDKWKDNARIAELLHTTTPMKRLSFYDMGNGWSISTSE